MSPNLQEPIFKESPAKTSLDEKRAEIERYKKQGINQRAIAKLVGVSRPTLRSWLFRLPNRYSAERSLPFIHNHSYRTFHIKQKEDHAA